MACRDIEVVALRALFNPELCHNDRPPSFLVAAGSRAMDDSEENIMDAQRVGMQTIHWSGKKNGFQEFNNCIHAFGNIKTG